MEEAPADRMTMSMTTGQTVSVAGENARTAVGTVYTPEIFAIGATEVGSAIFAMVRAESGFKSPQLRALRPPRFGLTM